MSLKIIAFLIAHLTMAEVYIWEYPSPIVVMSTQPDVGRYCPVADQFIQSGLEQSQVPVSTEYKIGSMMKIDKEGKTYILGLRGEPSYTATQMEKAGLIFIEEFKE